MRRILNTISFCLAALTACSTLPRGASTESTRTFEIRNGKWFTGSGFTERTWYTRNGLFSSSRPARVDSVIDLHEQYVVPPFAEAHNHWLEPKAIDAYEQAILRDGVFYLKDMSNAPVIRVLLDSALNKPTSVDFISPNQGFTGPGGHPQQIARQFLAAAAKRFGKKGPSLSPEAANLLLRYTWPGNVRELENALERALALARSDRIGVDDLPPELGAAPPTVQTADEVRTLAEVERDYIAAALRASGGNRAKAAEKLGIGAATLYRKLRQARPRAVAP